MRCEIYETDAVLEEYRIEILDTIGELSHWLRDQADEVLGTHVRLVVPYGDITNPTKFQESSDIELAFKICENGTFNEELSLKLQEHFDKLPLPGIGNVNVLVFSK